jgi:DNA-binding XRE family transcriptional regulator
MKTEIKDVGRQIRTMRRYRRHTQDDLAFLCKMNRSSLSNIEKGVRFPSLETVFKIADVLRCDIVISFRPRN